MDLDLIQAGRWNGDYHVPLPLLLQPEGGHVGINTNVPAAPFHVYSNGEVNYGGGLGIFGRTTYGHLEVDFDRIQSNYNNSPLTLWLQQNGGNLNMSDGGIFIEKSDSKIGFFTNTPSAPFHFYSQGEVPLGGGLAVLGNPNQGHLEMDFDRIQACYNNGGHPLYLQPEHGDLNVAFNTLFVDGDEKRVGINTTLPDADFQIKSKGENIWQPAFEVVGADNSSFFSAENNGVVNVGLAPNSPGRFNVRAWGNNGGTWAMRIFNGNGSSLLNVRDDGNIGVGNNTIPSSKLDVAGYVETFGIKDANHPSNSLEFPATTKISLKPYGDELMVLDGDNDEIIMADDNVDKVGIGESNPEAKLHIHGGSPYFKISSSLGHQFVIQGNISRTSVGIGTYSPNSSLHVVQGLGQDGLILERQDTEWRLMNNGGLRLYFDDFHKGTFDTEDGAYTNVSDLRVKKNIKDFGPALANVNQLRPVRYHFKNQEDSADKTIGFIAQEMNDLFPELVKYDDASDVYTLNYSGVSVVAIKAIQELSIINEDQRQIISKLTQENKTMKKRLDRLEAAIYNSKASGENN